MPGGILQLISSNGMNTLYLLGSPQITYFKLVYRRPTNFSIYDSVQYHSSSVEAGTQIDFEIEPRADLLNAMVLKIDLPTVNLKPIYLSKNNLEDCLNKYGIQWKSNNTNKLQLINELKKYPELANIKINYDKNKNNIRNDIDYENEIMPLINTKIDELLYEHNFTQTILMTKKNVDTKIITEYLLNLWINFISIKFDNMFNSYFNKLLTDYNTNNQKIPTTYNLTDKINALYLTIINIFNTNGNYITNNNYINKKIIEQINISLNLDEQDKYNLMITIISSNLTTNINTYLNELNLNYDNIKTFFVNTTSDFINNYGAEYIDNFDNGIDYFLAKYIGGSDKLYDFFKASVLELPDNQYYDKTSSITNSFIYKMINNPRGIDKIDNLLIDNSSNTLFNSCNMFRADMFNQFMKFIDDLILNNIQYFYSLIENYNNDEITDLCSTILDPTTNSIISNFISDAITKYGTTNPTENELYNLINFNYDNNIVVNKIQFAYYLNTFVINELCKNFNNTKDDIEDTLDNILENTNNYHNYAIKEFLNSLVQNNITIPITNAFYPLNNQTTTPNVYVSFLCYLFYYKNIIHITQTITNYIYLENNTNISTYLTNIQNQYKRFYKIISNLQKNFIIDCKNNILNQKLILNNSLNYINLINNIVINISLENIIIDNYYTTTKNDKLFFYYQEFVNNYNIFYKIKNDSNKYNFKYDIFDAINTNNINNINNIKNTITNDKIVFDAIISYTNDISTFDLNTMKNFFNNLNINNRNNLSIYPTVYKWYLKYNNTKFITSFNNIIGQLKNITKNEVLNDILNQLLSDSKTLFNTLDYINNIDTLNLTYLQDKIISLQTLINNITPINTYDNPNIKSIILINPNSINKYNNINKNIGSNLDNELKSMFSLVIPEYAWVKELGHRIINKIKLTIGEMDYEIHDGELLSYLHTLYDPVEKKSGYDKMIGNIPNMYNISSLSRTINSLYIPLRFFFCRSSSMALPLISLMNTKIKISVKLSELKDILYISSGSEISNKLYFNCALIGNYIYLEEDERKRFASTKMDYLIERFRLSKTQLIRHIDVIKNNNINVRLDSLDEPTKFLFWNVKFYNKPTELSSSIINWNEQGFNINTGQGKCPPDYILKTYYYFGYKYGVIVPNDNKNKVYKYNKIEDIFKETTIYTNGIIREDTRSNLCYNALSINKTLFNSLYDGQYMYSFSLLPTFLQPSGHCNFAQIADASIKFSVSQQIVDQYINLPALYGEIKIWSCSMNILRVISGMCGLAWTNMNDK